MIALDTSKRLNVGKSPKRARVEVEETPESDAEVSQNEIESDGDLADEENGESGNDSSDDQSDSEKQDSKTLGNAGWADVMQKILRTNKPKKKKTLVLSRAKKISEIVPKEITEKAPFEIEGDDGEVKEKIIDDKDSNKAKVVDNDLILKRKKKDPILSARTKPSVLDRERERMLQKIATKGVVQLFNVVRQQQSEIDKKLVEAGPLERKREKVMKSIDKRAFLDVLMGGTKSISVDNETQVTKKEDIEKKPSDKVWSVLRDDFVMGAKLKDWDKKAPEEDDSSAPEDMDSD